MARVGTIGEASLHGTVLQARFCLPAKPTCVMLDIECLLSSSENFLHPLWDPDISRIFSVPVQSLSFILMLE